MNEWHSREAVVVEPAEELVGRVGVEVGRVVATRVVGAERVHLDRQGRQRKHHAGHVSASCTGAGNKATRSSGQ